MKHNIAFVLFLTAILLAGFFSVDIASAMFSEKETTSVRTRSTQLSDSGSSSQEYTFGFDPMSLVRGDSCSPADGEYAQAAYAAASMMKNMSRSYIDWEFREDTAYRLLDEMKISDSGYAYAERFEYTSKRGNTELLDFMVNVKNLRIVYMRFYSAADQECDDNAVQSATRDLRTMSDRFYSEAPAMMYYDTVADLAYYSDSADEFDLGINDMYSYEGIDSAFSSAYDLGTRTAEECGFSELGTFWCRATAMSMTYSYEEYFCAETSNYILSAVLEDGMDECTYTVYKGRIYQCIDFGPNRLFVIYSIADGRPEGFFAKPSL
ncbi:MAG: hypothetical protein IJM44_02790 [Ruminococcus sp.]|nr:hypothetical protein [Ruminococcus sp.]